MKVRLRTPLSHGEDCQELDPKRGSEHLEVRSAAENAFFGLSQSH